MDHLDGENAVDELDVPSLSGGERQPRGWHCDPLLIWKVGSQALRLQLREGELATVFSPCTSLLPQHTPTWSPLQGSPPSVSRVTFPQASRPLLIP